MAHRVTVVRNELGYTLRVGDAVLSITEDEAFELMMRLRDQFEGDESNDD